MYVTDCRTHWKGRIAQAAIALAKTEGDARNFGTDGPYLRQGLAHVALSFAARIRLESEPAEIRNRGDQQKGYIPPMLR